MTIVRDGVSDYEILTATDAFPITRQAAKELQDYVKKTTGADLPIRSTDQAGAKPAIFVGDGPWLAAAGIDIQDLPPEGYCIKTVGKNLYISGRDTDGSAFSDHWRTAPQSGTWCGVAEFLESQLDVRWFFPTEQGEHIVPGQDLVVAELDVNDAPKMTYRRMAYLYDTVEDKEWRRDTILWKRRNRNGWSTIWQGSHSWLIWFKGETYFADHPEWFGFVNGRRLAHAPHGLQMCTTNPDALDEFARTIVDRGRKNPGVMFTLSPNDGGNHCECQRCRALDVEEFADGTPVLTDRYAAYCNEVAERVTPILPEQTFGFYAYSFYADPPRKTVLHPNVRIMEVLNDVGLFYYSPQARKHHLEDRLKPWRRAAGQLFFYTHPEGMGNLDLPSSNFEGIKAVFANLNAADVTGISMNMGASFAASGLNHYLYQKMAWNPGRDADALYADALLKCYGKAAPQVRKYFAVVEYRVEQFMQDAEKNFDRAIGSVRRFPGILEICYNGLYEQGMPLLKAGLAAVENEPQRARVQMLIENLEYSAKTVQLYNLSQKTVKARNPALTDVLSALDLARERREWMESHSKSVHGFARSKIGTEKQFNLPFDPSVYEYLLLKAKGTVTQASVPQIDTPPVIDGIIEEAAWAGCDNLNVNLEKDSGVAVAVSTVAQVCHDSEYIYFAIRCDEPMMAEVKDSVRDRDGPVWNENELEFFIDTNDDATSYYQLCVNSLGTVFDKKYTSAGEMEEWDSQIVTAAAKTESGWSIEMAIPFASLVQNAPLPADVWGFNLCRVRVVAEPREYTCWAPTFGGFHAPKRFGKLVLK